MRHKYLLYIFTLVIIISFNNTFAQGSADMIATTKVSQIPDEQIISLWNKGIAQGLSETEMYGVLKERGMPASEIEELKSRLVLLGLTGGSQARKSSTIVPAKKIDY